MSARQHTFLFADLAGYTALTEAHGDAFAADAVAEFVAGVRGLLPEYAAEEVKTIGDAMMIRVPDPTDGVRLAVRIIEEVGRRHGALAVRVGLHIGTAVERNGDWFGAAVNVSARVASAAVPGEVLMTAAIRAGTRGGVDGYQLERRGPRTFRNVSEPVELYALTLAAQNDTAHLVGGQKRAAKPQAERLAPGQRRGELGEDR